MQLFSAATRMFFLKIPYHQKPLYPELGIHLDWDLNNIFSAFSSQDNWC